MDVQQAFEQYVREEGLFNKQDRLLIAVSGGVDSVVLCDICSKAGFSFDIAHANFLLRGDDSMADEHFVCSLAERYETSCHVKKFDTKNYAASNKIGIQEAARTLRYNWFNELMHDGNGNVYSYLLTAHHADDQIETVLMNFFKGTGIRGLLGMSNASGLYRYVRRPLLFARKQQLIEFARQQSLPYREDASNAEDHYTRNYFRNVLIPGLEKIFPDVSENILNNISRFNDMHVLYNQSLDIIKKKLVDVQPDGIRMPVLALLKTPALHTVMFEIIRDYGFTAAQTEESLKLLHSESGKFIQSVSHRIFRNRKWLIISPVMSNTSTVHLLPEGQGSIEFQHGRLMISTIHAPVNIDTSAQVALLDAANIEYPLLLRRWKQGDYFYPLGMKKKKKLSRFFIDQKISVPDKEKIWVIESGKKIVWVVGLRIDDRYKITLQTTTVLQLTFVAA